MFIVFVHVDTPEDPHFVGLGRDRMSLNLFDPLDPTDINTLGRFRCLMFETLEDVIGTKPQHALGTYDWFVVNTERHALTIISGGQECLTESPTL